MLVNHTLSESVWQIMQSYVQMADIKHWNRSCIGLTLQPKGEVILVWQTTDWTRQSYNFQWRSPTTIKQDYLLQQIKKAIPTSISVRHATVLITDVKKI